MRSEKYPVEYAEIKVPSTKEILSDQDLANSTDVANPFQQCADHFMDDLFGDVEQLLSVNAPGNVHPITSARTAKRLAQREIGEPKIDQQKPEGSVHWLNLPGIDSGNISEQVRAQILQAVKAAPEQSSQSSDQSLKSEQYSTSNSQIVPIGSSLTLTKLNLPTLVVPEVVSDLEIWLPPATAKAAEPETAIESKPQFWFDRLLWLLLGLSISAASLSWLYSSKLIEIKPIAILSESVAVQTPTKEEIEAQNFATKTRQSLANLNIKPTSQTTEIAGLPSPLALQNPNQNFKQNQNPFVLPVQPIYVPVYQPPAAAPIPAPVQPTVRQPTPAPVAIARVNPEPTPSKSIQQPLIEPATTPKQIMPIASLNGKSKFKLVGILAFGEQSAAMVEVNGAFQTIKLNNPIGDSGWTLTGLNQQEAILKRNGETRSVTVGQKF